MPRAQSSSARRKPDREPSSKGWWLTGFVLVALLAYLGYQPVEPLNRLSELLPRTLLASSHPTPQSTSNLHARPQIIPTNPPSTSPSPPSRLPTPTSNTLPNLSHSSPPRFAISNAPPTLASNSVASTPPAQPNPAASPNAPSISEQLAFESILALQVRLARHGCSSGSLDGAWGNQSRSALRAFQYSRGLAPTGEPDLATVALLNRDPLPVLTQHIVSSQELRSLRPVPKTWRGKSESPALAHESVLELVAEKYHTHPATIRALNRRINFDGRLQAGIALTVPNIQYTVPAASVARIRISLSEKTLQAFDADGALLCHFPVSIAQRVDKRPIGDLRITSSIENPNYTFNPQVFPESAEARSIGHRLVLPPGPNNPVGVAWIGLSKSGYGIHGTPRPEEVGRTESHGCFRLANWNADFLRRIAPIGTPVSVEP